MKRLIRPEFLKSSRQRSDFNFRLKTRIHKFIYAWSLIFVTAVCAQSNESAGRTVAMLSVPYTVLMIDLVLSNSDD